MRGVLALVDWDLCEARGLSPARLGRAFVKARPVALQLRAKSKPSGDVLRLAKELAEICRDGAVPFYVNDRVEVALLVPGANVHLGQNDLTPDEARVLARGAPLGIGFSTHDVPQALASARYELSYVATGPWFPTRSKDKPDPTLGIERGREVVSAVRAGPSRPVVAIGGIGLEEAHALRGEVDAIACIAAITPERGGDPDEATRLLSAMNSAFGL